VSVVANNPGHDPKAAARALDAPIRFAPGPRPLIALTKDAELLATLKRVTEPAHQVWAASSEVDLPTGLMGHHAGVALIDCAALATPIATLTQRLHAQFPELVLIVAGSADEQGALAAQITAGSVHRFLHKPVSEQRVRLFVEAAWRRHEEAHVVPPPAALLRSPPPGRAARWWLGLVAAIAAAGPLLWIGTRTPEVTLPAAPPPRSTPASAVGDAALEGLLSRADQALAAGRLLAPPGDNAADLYREALGRNARDTRAVNGLEQVIERLLAAAETQLQEHHLDAAQQLVDQARAISPGHPRVAFVTAQIGAQRERAVLGKAQRAAAGGDVSGALAVLEDASRGSRPSTLVDEARQELAQQQVDARVTDFLNRSRDALTQGRLIEPVEDNARFYIESARALAPHSADVQQASQDLITRLESEGRAALTAGNADQADVWAAAAADAGADPGEVASLHTQAQQLRSAAKADALKQLVHSFDQALEQGHVVEPATDSAKFYLARLQQADATSPAAEAARTAYGTRLLDEARSTLRGQDFPATRRWLTEARTAGVDPQDIGKLDAALSVAQDEAQQASSVVNESTLVRMHYVAPQFPQAARERGIDGWVDLQYLVDTDGAVSDVAVVGAQPAGVFEQAALDAIRHWRYQPVVHGGHVVSQRTHVRLRFTVQR
jgi:TonB family protein